jgi:hypothetical protein
MMGNPTTSTQVHNFAIHHLYVGDDDPTPSYTADPNAWKSMGYNLDDKVTTSTSTNVCTPHMGGSVVADGNDGIDNAFGSNVIPSLKALIPNLSQTVSEKIIGGSFTVQIDTSGLDDTMTTQTATALGGQLFPGTTYTGGAAPPLNAGGYFTQTDSWPVDPSVLNGGTIASGSKLSFPAAYVTSGTWVSGTPINLAITLSIKGEALTLTIHHALLSFEYSVVNGQGLAKNGIIAGVLSTAEFIHGLDVVLGGVSNGQYCSLAMSLFYPKIYNAQDMVVDPTTGDISNPAGTPCNGISIGMAFDADEIAVPSVVATPTDAGAPTPCPGTPDAG